MFPSCAHKQGARRHDARAPSVRDGTATATCCHQPGRTQWGSLTRAPMRTLNATHRAPATTRPTAVMEGCRRRVTRLLNEEVARCAMVGAGVHGQDFGRPGDEDAPAATTENDSMTICSGFVRGEMGGTADGGAAGGGQASRRPVMLQSIFDAEWQRPRECIACSCFLHVFWHVCGALNHPNCKNIGYFESLIK